MQDSNQEVIWNRISSRLNARWQTNWAIKDQILNSTARPYDQRTFFIPLDPTAGWHSHVALAIYMFNGKRFSNRKETNLFSSAECSIWTQRVYGTESPADWMHADKPTELLRIKLIHLNSTARPYGLRTFSPLDPTDGWHSHLALVIDIFVVVNFDALAQASDFRIERRQVVFFCWMIDLNQEGLWYWIASRLNARWLTDLAIENQINKLELDSPSLWSANIQPPRLHCRLAFGPGFGDIHVCCWFDALVQVSCFRITRRQVVFLCWIQDSSPKGL